MKKYYIISIIFLVCIMINAQTINNYALTSTRGNHSEENFSLEYAEGEIISDAAKDDQDIIFPQGIMQSELLVSALIDENINTEIQISIFPNPFSHYINIMLNNINENKIIIKLIDITGKVWIEKEIELSANKKEFQIDTKRLNRGIYFITISAKEKLIKRTKLYKK